MNGESTFSGRRNDGLPVVQPVGLAVQSPPQQAASSQPLAAQRFEVVGRLLQARMLFGEQQTAVSQLTIEDGVCFQETQTAQSNERPLVIRGDRLEAADVAGPNAKVTVTGRPARFEGRGLGLTGSNINLDRGANLLWIDGPGQMDLPLPISAALPGQPPPAAPGVLTVDWQRRMKFDGAKVRFEQSVVAATGQQQLRMETMDVHLQRPIRFSEPNLQGSPKVEKIQCSGGVEMENRTFDQQRQLTEYDRMQVSDLGINLINGEINGGPGWLNSVRRGSADPLTSPATPAAAAAPANAVPGQDQLNALHVRFQKSIKGNVGNMWSRRVTFADQVRMAYAPVDNWDAMLMTDNPDRLGPRGVTVRCDQLTVAERLLPRRSVELEARGNTVVEGVTFTALADRITYDEAKDLLILAGDGRRDAELFRQLEVGAKRSHLAARGISYHPRTNRLGKIDGAQSLEFNESPKGNGK
jgi:hypothetical protein